MRILHLHLSREFAGSETYAASLARLQTEAGHTVALLVRDSPYLERWKLSAGAAAVLVIPAWAPGVLGWWVAKHYTRGFAPEVMHSHLGRAHKLGNWLGKRLQVPHVGTIHLHYKAKEHAACDALVAIAKGQLAAMPDGIRAKTSVIWNWLPLPVQPVRKGKAPQVFTFGSVGRLHPQKGMDVLVRAFRQAFPHNPDVRLEIVGEGPERAAIMAAAENDARVALLGYRNDVVGCYRRWQGYVSAARYEPFGLTILEAMAHHLPLVLTRTQGPTEFMAKQKGVHWAAPDDVGSLAKALQACRKAKAPVWDLTPFAPARALKAIQRVYDGLVL